MLGQLADSIGGGLAPVLAMPAVAMQRDGAADRMVWPEPLLAVLNPKLLVEQSPPDHHYLAGKFDMTS